MQKLKEGINQLGLGLSQSELEQEPTPEPEPKVVMAKNVTSNYRKV